MRKLLFRIFVKFFARDLIRSAYTGILGRRTDTRGLEAYALRLQSGDLSAVLEDISGSEEALQHRVATRGRFFTQAAYRGLLGREAESSALAHYEARLAETQDFPGLLTELALSEEHGGWFLEHRPEIIVDAAYRGLLGRDPDPQARQAYAAELAKSRDTAALLSVIGTSEEHWLALFATHRGEFIHAVYRGVLQREPDASELAMHGPGLAAPEALQQLIATTLASDAFPSSETWQRKFLSHPALLVQMAYRGLLGREAESSALAHYEARLAETQDFPGLLSAICQSNEAWNSGLRLRAENFLRDAHVALLGREPDSRSIKHYVDRLRENAELIPVIAAIASSREASLRQAQRRYPDYNRTYAKPTWVFLHIEKTAGTSLQNMLRESFGRGRLYHEHGDTLQWRSPAELSQYAAFAGHFNYDSLALIPRNELRVFAILAEPVGRILSLYRFWRAHKPSAPAYHKLMKYAAEHDIRRFLQLDDVRTSPAVFNHMTYCLMGRRIWEFWRTELARAKGPKRQTVIRAISSAIRARLKKLAYVGLKEEFEASCTGIFKAMKRPRPEIRFDHSIEVLARENLHIANVEPSNPDADVLSEIDPLIELDRIAYREAQNRYRRASRP